MTLSKWTFINSISNEIIVDDYYCEANGLMKHLNRPVAKVASIPTILVKRPILLKYLLNGFDNYFWCLLYVLIFLRYIKYLILWLFVKRYKGDLPNSLFINTSSRLITQCEKIDFTEEKIFLTIRRSRKETNNETSIYFLSLLNLKEIWKCYRETNSQLILIRKFYGKYYSIHVLKAFDWLLLYCALKHCKKVKEFIFCNHYDRWALLFDHFRMQKKIMIQHGVLNHDLSLPQKLHHVDLLYCYNQTQEKYFANIIEKILKVKYYKSTLLLSPLTCNKKLHVLIIGNCMVYKELEEFFIRNFFQNKVKIDLYVKPHPVFSTEFYDDLRKKYSFILIHDKSFFPAVDIVLSYDSTLAYEYETANIPVLYYKNLEKEEILKKIFDFNL